MRTVSFSLACGLMGVLLAGAAPPEKDAAPPGPTPPVAGGEDRAAARDFKEIYAPTAITRAVDEGLAFLRQRQEADGSWLTPGYGKNTGIASLAILAILSAGNEPGRGAYGECIDRALRFVLSRERDGMILPLKSETSHGPMYEHGIATLMLGEVLGMVRDDSPGLEKLRRTHRSAVNLILRAQNVPRDRFSLGGWRYTPDCTDADLSVTGWQLLALRAAQDAGLPVPRKNIDQAVLYVKRCIHPSGGFGYMSGPGYDPGAARTGTGVLALQICGDFQSPEALRGGDWLLKHPPDDATPFYYYSVYYATQAMNQIGGPYWEKWRPLGEDMLLKRRRTDGSWAPLPREPREVEAGPIYATALAILSLTVDYKYLPIYQR